MMGKIDNNGLLSEEGILSLKRGLHWHQDFELVEPLVWSALQAWHDGGPPITREVVPSTVTTAASAGGASEAYEIELYPLYASVFLCDGHSRGEPRPFQQFVPLSRHLPLSDLVGRLREGLGRDARLKRYDCRLWLMDGAYNTSVAARASNPTPADMKDDEMLGWKLDLDLTILDERNSRGKQLQMQLDKDENISLMLELRNGDGKWPREVRALNLSGQAVSQEGEGGDEEKDELALGDGIVGLYNMG